MNLLLDTHAFVWAVGAPGRLSKRAARALRTPANELAVSAATAWELAIKHRLGCLPEAGVLLSQFEGVADELGARLVPMDAADAILAGSMQWDHRDPFDRMLAAQAVRSNLTLLSRDTAFEEVKGLKLLW